VTYSSAPSRASARAVRRLADLDGADHREAARVAYVAYVACVDHRDIVAEHVQRIQALAARVDQQRERVRADLHTSAHARGCDVDGHDAVVVALGDIDSRAARVHRHAGRRAPDLDGRQRRAVGGVVNEQPVREPVGHVQPRTVG